MIWRGTPVGTTLKPSKRALKALVSLTSSDRGVVCKPTKRQKAEQVRVSINGLSPMLWDGAWWEAA
jgi:hypothetical protein